jgi:hypothetical protein
MALSENWFVEGSVDFEMQKYRLLAYLQEIESSFEAQRLYPPLLDLHQHYANLRLFLDRKQQLEDQFPRRISAMNLASGRISWERLQQEEAGMDELEEITTYAWRKMRHTLDTGTGIYEEVVRQMEIEPVGINPATHAQGYLLLCLGSIRETRAYQYYVTRLELRETDEAGLRLQYLGSWPQDLVNTPNTIKQELVRKGSALHNPAAFALATNLKMPVDETLLPVARQVFSRYLAQA